MNSDRFTVAWPVSSDCQGEWLSDNPAVGTTNAKINSLLHRVNGLSAVQTLSSACTDAVIRQCLQSALTPWSNIFFSLHWNYDQTLSSMWIDTVVKFASHCTNTIIRLCLQSALIPWSNMSHTALTPQSNLSSVCTDSIIKLCFHCALTLWPDYSK